MAETQQDEPARRSSIEKQPVMVPVQDPEPSALDRLPDEIIQQYARPDHVLPMSQTVMFLVSVSAMLTFANCRILLLADPDTFASLILLNSRWRHASQEAHLFAHQLSQSPSYAASHKGTSKPITEDDLPRLRRLFACEVKRNLFGAYLRPNKTIIKLISNSISSSSCPGGEGIQFTPSPRGHHLLGYNSSRIYVIDVRGADIVVQRELKILRRPAATCITDSGSFLAVLLTEMQVDLYDLSSSPPKRTQSIILDHSPRAIALSPCGGVLAAAYEGGIEVSSLKSSALPTDRRAVKCDAVDSLAFSFDGTQILGTTTHSSQPSTVIITAPYYDPGAAMMDEDPSALWTTSILFPNSSRDCSHAVLIQNSTREEAEWAFTYDRSFETFRAVRIEDLRNGTTYFTGPIPSLESQAKLLPCTLPAASYCGELVSAGFQGHEIWLYGVPEDLDAVPDPPPPSSDGSSGGLSRQNSGGPMRTPSRGQEPSTEARMPQWQVLCDKMRNTFVAGCKIAELNGVNTVKWVEGFGNSSVKERLLVAARGVLPPKPITEEDGLDFVDGGRITLIDFDYATQDGQEVEIEIEVGTKEPEVLEEETRDMDTEVAIVRRRTVAQKRGNRSAVGRTATMASRAPPVPQVPPVPSASEEEDPLVPRRIGVRPVQRQRTSSPPPNEEHETESIIEEQEALDLPYSHASPRSGTTLRRAATAAATNRRLHPTTASGAPIQYRRADGRAEHPHESDADNWVPPPPPYQADDPGDLPAFMRHNVPAVTPGDLSLSPSQRGAAGEGQAGESVSAHTDILPERSRTTAPGLPSSPPGATASGVSRQRSVSNDASMARPKASDFAHYNRNSTAMDDEEGIYDVSPPESPKLANGAPDAAGVRDVSGSSTNAGPSVSPATSTPAIPPQQVSPAQPQMEMAAPVPPAQPSHGPPLNLNIPTPASSNNFKPLPLPPADASPIARRISVSRTWPTQPNPEQAAASTNATAGYPYSAPVTNVTTDQMMMTQALPPAPRTDQLASLHRHDGQRPPSHRFSGVFQLSRVPVGSRDSDRRSSSLGGPLPMPPTGQEQPLAPPHHSFEPRRPSSSPLPPVEDQPLIISTPTGVSGAYDPPGRVPSTHVRQEPTIFAPVPRHPPPAPGGRATPAAEFLRPTAERLETIYSEAGAGAAAATYSQTSGAPSVVGRRPSRAERSAAKNMADAKRRGWRRARSVRKVHKKNKGAAAAAAAMPDRDLDAWTDVTASSGMGAYPPGAWPPQQQQQQQQGAAAQGGRAKGKSGKCVVM
ncbi:uncharacterized protein E0L32_004385 [Thyridium curvatum]|uniref:DUF7165 domain-containing protein n=1 Tax=Thyridium curvatum TaxID=1093900 RepID=A0A507AX96_9PEZI|nr:uncharacterized protein E0L32_004385 [Thyridium curvatum]TPX15405.1 hypothetical protein E0L32_004385 [Thyridium curvatum]